MTKPMALARPVLLGAVLGSALLMAPAPVSATCGNGSTHGGCKSEESEEPIPLGPRAILVLFDELYDYLFSSPR